MSRYHRPHEMYKDKDNTKKLNTEKTDTPLSGMTPPPPPPPSFPPPPDVTSPPSRGSSASDIGSTEKTNAATLPAGECLDKNGELDIPKRRSNRNKTKSELIRLLSSLYARLLIVASAIMTFSEVLDNQISLFYFHGYLYTFIVGGAIICLLGIYITMMVDKCPNLTGGDRSDNVNDDLAPFKKKTCYYSSEIYIYLRLGAVAFGLGTLISTGLEIGTIFTIEDNCMNELNLAQPFLRGLFTFLQMHFLFMNAQDLLQALGWFRHVALMHLMAANLAIWLRLLFFESSFYWMQVTHFHHNATLNFPDPTRNPNISLHTLDKKGGHISFWSKDCWWHRTDDQAMEDVLEVYYCLQNTSIGVIWEKSLPYLSPCIVQYSLLSAAVIYFLWENLDNTRVSRKSLCSSVDYDPRITKRRKSFGNLNIDCQGSSKGLFLGLLLLVAGIIVLILFFVLSHEKKFQYDTIIALTTMHCAVLIISALATILGIFQIHKVRTRSRKPQELHSLLQNVGLLAVFAFGFLNMIVGGTNLLSSRYIILFLDGAFMVIQACVQSLFAHQVGRKSSSPNTEFNRSKPGRQIVTFLVFANLVLWLMESFLTQDRLATQLQMQFYGDLPWGVLSRIALPLVVFYRFHSSASLMESWKRSYKVLEDF
ncbi:otopetrin-2-like [Centruroides sculpturatus]|uniref:otopetrin-2-like n=1 Tax=Centruroides sculpturatus TaxID=218467 RepID=UPI000C6DE2EB|nr:otopetrin-2-like [Centruroides sculpturatus]XP_023218270.1 otopetrin-2-like [Centruroides sculpturatus]XP_023218278.1 otopetrin-2-like [Centruroides sculpturatus]